MTKTHLRGDAGSPPAPASPRPLRSRTAESGAGGPSGSADGADRRGVLGRILRVPLFYKLLVGNLAVAAGAVAATVWLLHAYRPAGPGSPSSEAWIGLGAVLLAGTLVVNGVLVRIALSPVADLERTARAISGGFPARHVPISPVADRDLERLIRSFNEMLDRLERYRSRLRDLAARALDAQEAERKRVARELHDDTAQRLAAVLLRLESLRRNVRSGSADDELGTVRDELAAALESLRRFARGLRPPALDDLGLCAAVEAHLRDVEARTDLEVRFDRPPDEPELSATVELAAYRIVQEAVANVVRHAGASRVEVSVSSTGARLELRVVDDGRGFEPSEVLDGHDEAMGLFGMKERATYVNGTVELTSRPGRGTSVRVTLATGPPGRER